MTKRLGFLIAGTLLLWLLAAYPASWYWPKAWVQSGTAMLLCLVPAALTLFIAGRTLTQPPELQLITMLGATGLRMAFVLGLGLVLYWSVPELDGLGFWIWLLVFYLYTLTLDVWLLFSRDSRSRA